MRLGSLIKQQLKNEERNKRFFTPKNAFEGSMKYRFTFVFEGGTYFGGYTVLVSENVLTKTKAFYIACESFLKKFSDKTIKNVAVFYGDVEAPECEDVLYRAYNSFDKVKK